MQVKQDEVKEVSANAVAEAQEKKGERRPYEKRDANRFEFALFINDSPICKRSFSINGYVDGSMQTPEFKNEIDKIVELIDEDLKSKSRVYTWHHTNTEYPDWEPEIMTDPLVDEGEFIFKFAVFDGGKEVVSKQWDGRYYPSYIRKGVDLTNRQVKIVKDERTYVYDKESFFENHNGQLSIDMYILKNMIGDKENLVPIIQKCIYEVCSSYDGYYEKSSDYHTVVEYRTNRVKRDADGKPMYRQKTYKAADGTDVPVVDAFGNPWMVPVLEPVKGGTKYYNYNIKQENMRINSMVGQKYSEKTKKYMSELYVRNADRHRERGSRKKEES